MGTKHRLENWKDSLCNLITQASGAGNKEVAKVIGCIKAEDSFEKNVANMKREKEKELRATLGFMLNCKEDDDRVARLRVAGLRKIIMWRALQLDPRQCRTCNSFYHYERTEEPEVKCRRCSSGACPTCFPQTERHRTNKWSYLCDGCGPEVEKDMGYERLAMGDFDPKYDEKKKDDEDEEADTEVELIKEVQQSQDMFAGTQGEATLEEGVEGADLENDEDFAENALRTQGRRPDAKEKANVKEKVKVNENTTCPHLMKGRCFFGISGRRHHKDRRTGEMRTKCPFLHPRVCDKLLRHGRGDKGCQGAGCTKAHPKMCPHSLEGVCMDAKCSLGLHVQGSNTREKREKVQTEKGRREEVAGAALPPLPTPNRPDELSRQLGRKAEATNDPPVATNTAEEAFLGQILLRELIKSVREKEVREEVRVTPQAPQANLLQQLLRSLAC